jgi:hypothetical protein
LKKTRYQMSKYAGGCRKNGVPGFSGNGIRKSDGRPLRLKRRIAMWAGKAWMAFLRRLE